MALVCYAGALLRGWVGKAHKSGLFGLGAGTQNPSGFDANVAFLFSQLSQTEKICHSGLNTFVNNRFSDRLTPSQNIL